MNTIDCIKTRRSVRKFKDEQIKDDELIQVLEAGTWSPTSMGALSIGYEAEGGSHAPKPRKPDYYKIVK